MDLVVLESFLDQVLCEGRSPENFFKVHLSQSMQIIDLCAGAIFVVRTAEAKSVGSIRLSIAYDTLFLEVGSGRIEIMVRNKTQFILNALKTIQFAFKLAATKKIILELDKSWSFSSLNLIQELIALYKNQSVVTVSHAELLRRIWCCLAVIPHYPHGRQLKHMCCQLHEDIIAMTVDRGAISLMLTSNGVSIDDKGYEAWASMTRTFRMPLLRQSLTSNQIQSLLEMIKLSIKHVDCIWVLDKLISTATKNTGRLKAVQEHIAQFPWLATVKRFVKPGLAIELAMKITDITQFFARHLLLSFDDFEGIFDCLWIQKPLFPDLTGLVLSYPSPSAKFTMKWMKRFADDDEPLISYATINYLTLDFDSLDLLFPLLSSHHHSKRLSRLLSLLTKSESIKSGLHEYLGKQKWISKIAYSHLMDLSSAFILLYSTVDNKSHLLSSKLLEIITNGFESLDSDQQSIVSLCWLIITPDYARLEELLGKFFEHLSSGPEIEALIDIPRFLLQRHPHLHARLMSSFGTGGSARNVFLQFSRSTDLKVLHLLKEMDRAKFMTQYCPALGYCVAKLPEPSWLSDFSDFEEWEPRFKGMFFEAALFYNQNADLSILRSKSVDSATIESCFREDFFCQEIEMQYYQMMNLYFVLFDYTSTISSATIPAKRSNDDSEQLLVDVEFDGGAYKDQVLLSTINKWPVLLHLKTFSSSDFSLRIPSKFLPSQRHHRTLQRLLTGLPLVHPSLRNFDVGIYIEAAWIGIFLGNLESAKASFEALKQVLQDYNRNALKLATAPIKYWAVIKRIFEECPMIPVMGSTILDSILVEFCREACRVLRDGDFKTFHENLHPSHRLYIISRVKALAF